MSSEEELKESQAHVSQELDKLLNNIASKVQRSKLEAYTSLVKYGTTSPEQTASMLEGETNPERIELIKKLMETHDARYLAELLALSVIEAIVALRKAGASSNPFDLMAAGSELAEMIAISVSGGLNCEMANTGFLAMSMAVKKLPVEDSHALWAAMYTAGQSMMKMEIETIIHDVAAKLTQVKGTNSNVS